MISYADFVTLLLALFVVLFASAQSDKGRVGAIAESVRHALEQDRFTTSVASLWSKAPKKDKADPTEQAPGGAPPEVKPTPADSDQLSSTLKELQTSLAQELSSDKLEVRRELRGIVISLAQAAFFPSAEDAIAAPMYPSLEKIAKIIGETQNNVRLEGHTDNIPIRNARFRSNWELSTARGIAVFDFLTQRCGLAEERFAVSGHAHTVPADVNDTAEGRAKNRRVDIVLLSRFGRMNEPSRNPAVERH